MHLELADTVRKDPARRADVVAALTEVLGPGPVAGQAPGTSRRTTPVARIAQVTAVTAVVAVTVGEDRLADQLVGDQAGNDEAEGLVGEQQRVVACTTRNRLRAGH